MRGATCGLLGVFASWAIAGPAAPGSERTLAAGERTEAQLEAEPHVYTASLDSGQFLRLTVVQDGVDVRVAIVAAGGQRTMVDVVQEEHGEEPASILAEASGVYRVEVAPARGAGPGSGGRYALVSEPARSATAADRARAAAERALAAGARLSREPAAESVAQGMAALDEALALWRKLGDRRFEAETLLVRGAAYAAAGDQAGAGVDATAALGLLQILDDRRGEARALQLAGAAHYEQYDYEAAIGHFERALALRRALGDKRGEAAALGGMGWAISRRGDIRRHLGMAREVVALWREIGDVDGEARALEELAGAQVNAGELQEAIEGFNEIVRIRHAQGNRAAEASALSSLGTVYDLLGDGRTAVDVLTRALSIFAGLTDRESKRNEAATFNNLAGAWSSLGESDKALQLYRTALARNRALPDALIGEGSTLNNIGHELGLRGEHARAIAELDAALELAAKTANPWLEAAAVLNRGTRGRPSGRPPRQSTTTGARSSSHGPWTTARVKRKLSTAGPGCRTRPATSRMRRPRSRRPSR